ncbi:MAG: VgrG-related protein [Chloroflexi bacterium]|nr:VgrG-related protein [Chloroflexota bacterium]
MPQHTAWVDQIDIRINGDHLRRELMDALVDVIVDTSLHMPTMFTLRVHDDELRWMDENLFRLGAPIEIRIAPAGGSSSAAQRIMSGEITAIEPEFSANQSATLVVRGYDRSHRLNRGTKSRAYVQVTDSDIVQQIAREANLQAQTDSTSEVYAHVYQHNQTDLAFLQERAQRIGFEVFVDENKLYFRRPRGQRGNLELEWGVQLRAFFPRLTLVQQVDEVIVKGWDPATKREIIGKANASESAPQINAGGSGGQLATRAFASPARQVIVRQSVASQRDADTMAQSVLDEINAGFVEAEGIALGNPAIVAGKKLRLERLGQRFSGVYMISSASHIYAQDGYEVHFRVEGPRPKTMADLVVEAVGSGETRQWGGVVVGIVTNNQDTEKLGRVKLKFPWLDGALESNWARVMVVGGGADRGLLWLPEVNDEVLVAFEHGDFDRPYVVGNLWNGTDKPPNDINQAVKNGKVEIRTLRTRTGHTIRLIDDSANTAIEIVDAEQCNRIKLDLKSRKMEITSQGEITITSQGNANIEAQGNLSIKGGANVNVEASGQLNLKGATVNIN